MFFGCDCGTETDNTAPIANIIAPSNSAHFDLGDSIIFTGSATDPEDGDLIEASLVWTSNIDGNIGTGTTFACTLSAGVHSITLVATDSEGETGPDSIHISIGVIELSEIGFYDTGDLACDVHLSGNYAYVADMEDGLRVINISDPTTPIEDGFCDTEGQTWDVYIFGSYAYVADRIGLRVIDISDPENPVEVGSFSTPSTAEEVYVSGN